MFQIYHFLSKSLVVIVLFNINPKKMKKLLSSLNLSPENFLKHAVLCDVF